MYTCLQRSENLFWNTPKLRVALLLPPPVAQPASPLQKEEMLVFFQIPWADMKP